MTDAGLAAIAQARTSGSWESAYTNKVRDVVPSDLESALREQEPAWQNFLNFANTYRNMYVSWVTNAKTDETRKRRIETVVKQALLNKKIFLGAEG
jgi:uncharacterized protein YdeI (YjbR/CyaY-like superfamily)